MEIHLGNKLRLVTWCCLLFAVAPAQATESLDCGNDQQSIQVLCSSEGCNSFALYVGSTPQSVVAWRVVRSDINQKKRTIIFKVINQAHPSDSIELNAKRHKGTLLISGQRSSVKCDWSALEL